MEEFLNSNSFKWILSIVIVIAGWLIGILINRFIYKKIKKISQKTHRRYYYLIVKKIKNLITLLLVLIATYIAVNIAPISTDVLKYVNNILKILLIITITLLISRLLSNYVQYLLKKSNKLTSKTSIFSVIIDILIYTIGIIVILHTLGISVKAIVASLGIGGLAVALALQETLTNLFAGIQLMLSKKIQIGDYIRLDSGEEGKITDITWRETTIQQILNNVIIVPNSKMTTGKLINYYLPDGTYPVIIPIGVSYNSDLEKVENITLDVANEIIRDFPNLVSDVEPSIRFQNFGEYSINFNVVFRASIFENQFILKHEFIKRLYKRYEIEGIEIPFPITTVNLNKQE